MILYFDVFKHPLQIDELVRLVAPDNPQAVQAAIAELVSRRVITINGRHCHRVDREAWVQRRAERAAHAERLWPMARRVGRALALTP
jgi:hypothetical protein